MTPISATGRPPRGKAGFTLVEIMVVVAILGLAAGFVVLTLPDREPSLAAEAERFAARLVHAREEAVMSNRTIEVRLGDGGYDFGLVSAGTRERLDDRPFGQVAWAEDTNVRIVQGGEASRIAFDPTGQAIPLQVVLSRGERRMAVNVDAAGNVEIDAPG